MVLFSVGCVLIVCSLLLFMTSYRMYSYRGLLQDGYIYVRVLTSDKSHYGWVMKHSVSALDRINHDRYQWFIELYSKQKCVIKIADIKEIKMITNPFVMTFRSSRSLISK